MQYMLCSRCGGNVFEELSEAQLRCVDCGLGSTRGVLGTTSFVLAVPVGETALADHQARLEPMQQGYEEQFRSAPFRPYALDERWTGPRSYGGSGSSNGRTNRLRIAHIDASANVRVETTYNPELAFEHRRWYAARDLIFNFWTDTEPLPADVRHAVFASEPGTDPLAPWEHTTTTVDGRAVPFAVLQQGDGWAGIVITPDLDLEITVQSNGWPVDQTGLARVDDLGASIQRK